MDSNMVILAFDQSQSTIGWVLMLGKDVHSHGQFKPDPIHFDKVREWVRGCIGQLIKDGFKLENITVATEDVYLAHYNNKPQVHTLVTLLSIREHIHAASRDMGVNYLVITPFNAMNALTGINNIYTKREERKAAMMKSAELLLGEKVSEHEADALGVGMAAFNALFAQSVLSDS